MSESNTRSETNSPTVFGQMSQVSQLQLQVLCPQLTARNEHAHSYALRFLLLDKAAASDSSEALNLIAEIQVRSQGRTN